jgi:glutamine synthetase
MTKESVLEFAEDIDLNFDEIALPDSVIDFTEEEIPENLDEDLQNLEKKDFKVSLVFKSEEQIKDFIEMYEQELKEKYNCYVSVAGGGL